MSLDSQITLYLNEIIGKSPLLDTTVLFLTSYLPWILFLIFLIFLYRSPSRKYKNHLVFIVVSSVVLSHFVIGEFIRFFYHRPRPFITYETIQPLFKIQEWSFPSGHALILFAFATSVYIFHKKLGIGLFIAAAIVCISRVIAGVHYPSDIVAGALIGAATSHGLFLITSKYARLPLTFYRNKSIFFKRKQKYKLLHRRSSQK